MDLGQEDKVLVNLLLMTLRLLRLCLFYTYFTSYTAVSRWRQYILKVIKKLTLVVSTNFYGL